MRSPRPFALAVALSVLLVPAHVRASQHAPQLTEVGASQQVSGEYCHFYTFRRRDGERVDMNILTAVYTEPVQLERFFIKVPTKPIMLYSHNLRLERRPP